MIWGGKNLSSETSTWNLKRSRNQSAAIFSWLKPVRLPFPAFSLALSLLSTRSSSTSAKALQKVTQEKQKSQKWVNSTVDGWNPAITSWVWVNIPLFIYRVFDIPGGCLGFLNHQQYVRSIFQVPSFIWNQGSTVKFQQIPGSLSSDTYRKLEDQGMAVCWFSNLCNSWMWRLRKRQ